jgi:hypothetical protein
MNLLESKSTSILSTLCLNGRKRVYLLLKSQQQPDGNLVGNLLNFALLAEAVLPGYSIKFLGAM